MPSSPQEYHDRVLGTSEIRASRYVLSKEHGTVAVGPAAKKEWHGLTLQVGGIEP